jgi:hypothetical protein
MKARELIFVAMAGGLIVMNGVILQKMNKFENWTKQQGELIRLSREEQGAQQKADMISQDALVMLIKSVKQNNDAIAVVIRSTQLLDAKLVMLDMKLNELNLKVRK